MSQEPRIHVVPLLPPNNLFYKHLEELTKIEIEACFSVAYPSSMAFLRLVVDPPPHHAKKTQHDLASPPSPGFSFSLSPCSSHTNFLSIHERLSSSFLLSPPSRLSLCFSINSILSEMCFFSLLSITASLPSLFSSATHTTIYSDLFLSASSLECSCKRAGAVGGHVRV